MKAPIKNMNLRMSPNGDVTQWFGVNPELYAQFDMKGHNGADLVRPHGTPMYAIETGTIIGIKNNPWGYGKNLRLLADSKDSKGRQRVWVYAHNSENLVSVGDRVKEGDHIANMGNTGFTISGATPYWNVNPFKGTHLHLGLRICVQDPKGWSYEGSDIKIRIENYNNGYKGAIDPRAILESIKEEPTDKEKKVAILRSLLGLYQQLLVKMQNK